MPLVPRGAGSGYTGGAVPIRGGVVLSLERMNRILEIDEANLLAIVEPNVITGDLQDAVERVGLFYPPDPASLRVCALGGNVAECAGGPRAFKYGTTKRYVLGPRSGAADGRDRQDRRQGGEERRRLRPDAAARGVRRHAGDRHQDHAAAGAAAAVSDDAAGHVSTIEAAVAAVVDIIRARVVPAALELIDGESLEAVAQNLGVRSLAPEGTAALLLLEVDGVAAAVEEEASRVEQPAATPARPKCCRARDEAERQNCGGSAARLSLALQDGRRRSSSTTTWSCRRAGSAAVRAGRAAAAGLRAARSRRSATPATATSTSTSWSIRTTRTRSRARRRRSGCCSRAWWRSKDRSAASTASASRRRRTWRSSSSPDEIALMRRVKQRSIRTAS